MINKNWKFLVIIYMAISLGMSCSRESIDRTEVDWDDPLPEIHYDSTGIVLRSAGTVQTYTAGEALVEDNEGKKFVSIVVKVGNEKDEPAFLMAWECDELIAGLYEGLTAVFALPDPVTGEVGEFFLESGMGIGSFQVSIAEVDTVNHKLIGSFEGIGEYSNDSAESVEFEGKYNLDIVQ